MELSLINIGNSKGIRLSKIILEKYNIRDNYVVLSPDEMNKYLHTIVVAPMTRSSKSYPTRVEVKHKATKGWIVIDPIRTIDRVRIVKRYEALTDKEIEKVKTIIQETFVD